MSVEEMRNVLGRVGAGESALVGAGGSGAEEEGRGPGGMAWAPPSASLRRKSVSQVRDAQSSESVLPVDCVQRVVTRLLG